MTPPVTTITPVADDPFTTVFGQDRGNPPLSLFHVDVPPESVAWARGLTDRLLQDGEEKPLLEALAVAPDLMFERPLARTAAQTLISKWVADTAGRLSGSSAAWQLLHHTSVHRQQAETILTDGHSLHLWLEGMTVGTTPLANMSSGEQQTVCGKAVWLLERAQGGAWQASGPDALHHCRVCENESASLPECAATSRSWPLPADTWQSWLDKETERVREQLVRKLARRKKPTSGLVITSASYERLWRRLQAYVADSLAGSQVLHERVLSMNAYQELQTELDRAGVAAPVHEILNRKDFRRLIKDRDHLSSSYEFELQVTSAILKKSGLADLYFDRQVPMPSWRKSR